MFIEVTKAIDQNIQVILIKMGNRPLLTCILNAWLVGMLNIKYNAWLKLTVNIVSPVMHMDINDKTYSSPTIHTPTHAEMTTNDPVLCVQI